MSKNLSMQSTWKFKILKNLGIFTKGNGVTKNDLVDIGKGVVRYGELYTTHQIKINKFHSYINEELASVSKKIHYGDILFAGSGETNADIGKAAVFLLNAEGYAGGDIIIFTPNNQDSLFLSYQLNSRLLRKELSTLGQGQSVVHIYKRDLENLAIVLPPLPEQKAIVSILETWDKAIDALARKIELKKQNKKGLMQRLLTGNTRLKGSSGEWITVQMSNIFEKIERHVKENDDIKSYTISSKRGFVTQQEKFNRVIAGSSLQKYILLHKGEFSYNKGNSKTYPFGCIFLFTDDRGVVPFVYISFKNKGDIDSVFYKYYFESGLLERELKKIITSGARSDGLLNVSKHNFFKCKVLCPPQTEQNKIGKILSIVDQEIHALQNKKEYLEQQKKFLLNNLMTGKIRVPGIIHDITKNVSQEEVIVK